MTGKVVLVAVAGACGKSPPGDGGPTTEPVPVELAPCGFAEAASGTIDVSEEVDRFHADPFARVEAALKEGPEPLVHAEADAEAECRSIVFAPGNCDPACTGAEVCTSTDECRAFPATVAGGTLTLDGLTVPVAIEAAGYSPGTYHGPAGLPADLFTAGDPVVARLAGAELPALALAAEGVEPIDGTLRDVGLVLTDGTDAEVTWTPGPDPGACVALVIDGFNVSHGGPILDTIRCETTDTGALVVPAALVGSFPYGTTPEVTEGYDWPHSTLTRYTRARVDTEFGPVELRVRSTTSFLVEHPTP